MGFRSSGQLREASLGVVFMTCSCLHVRCQAGLPPDDDPSDCEPLPQRKKMKTTCVAIIPPELELARLQAYSGAMMTL